MDPITMLIGLSIAGYVIGGVTTDAIAVARRMPAPSHEKWKARHEAKQQRGEHSDPNPGYAKRLFGNAAERWATKSDQKHRADMAFLAERGPHMTAKRLDKKRRNADRYESAARAVADRAGVVWGKTRDAAEQARDRRAESRAWRENERRDDRDGDAGLGIVEDDGWIDEHGRGHPRRWESDRGTGWELPVVYDDDGTGWYVHPDGSRSRVDEDPDTLAAIDDAMDEMDGPDNVVPLHRADTDKQEGSTRSNPDNDLAERDHTTEPDSDSARSDAEEAITMTEQPTIQTVSAEITNLTQAKAYTSGMSGYLGQVHSAVEANTSEITKLSDDVAAERVNAEMAASSARAQGMSGEHVAALDRAAEALAMLQDNLASAADALSGVPDVATAATGSFTTAHDEFDAQTGIAEQVQVAGDAAADNTDFYAKA